MLKKSDYEQLEKMHNSIKKVNILEKLDELENLEIIKNTFNEKKNAVKTRENELATRYNLDLCNYKHKKIIEPFIRPDIVTKVLNFFVKYYMNCNNGLIYIDHIPTLNDIGKLHSTQYYFWENNIYVQASRINLKLLYFICPLCFSNYKINGEPTKRAKHIIHVHGNSYNLLNRFEYKSSHCVGNYTNELCNEYDFVVGITDNTLRY